jgi:hypothetical protein
MARAPLLALALALAIPPAAAREPAPIIEDDWPRALAEAKARDVPLFIDAWAPW